MYQVNLLPWRTWRQQQRYHFWRRGFYIQLLAMLGCLVLAHWALGYQQTQQRQLLSALVQQQTHLSEQILQRQKMMTELANLAAKAKQRQQNRAHNQRYIALLQHLAQTLPTTLWLTDFEENAKGISLRGYGAHYLAIVAFEQDLISLPLLKNSRLAEVVQRKDGLLAFTVTALWRQDG